MHPVLFTLQFRGSAGPVPGREGTLAARTTARSQVHRTALQKAGVQGRTEPAGGGTATFASEVQITGEGTFLESGRITYGAAGSVTFKTVGHGVLGPSGIAGYQRGAVIWEVTGGDQRLAGATGLITSNFSVGPQGEVVDTQVAHLLLPGEARAAAQPRRRPVPKKARSTAARRGERRGR